VVTARVISEYIGGTGQIQNKEVADILLHLEFHYVDMGETLSKLVFLQSKKLIPTPETWSARTFEELLAGSYLSPTRFVYSKESRISRTIPEQHNLLIQFPGFVYYMIHCPWDIETTITRPAESPIAFSQDGTGGCRLFSPASISTQGATSFSSIESESDRLPEFVRKLLTCDKGQLFLQEKTGSELTMRPLKGSNVLKKYFTKFYMSDAISSEIRASNMNILESKLLVGLMQNAVPIGIRFEFRSIP